MKLEQREFRADPQKMTRLRVAAGMTVKDVIATTGLDRTTVNKVLRGEPVFLKSLAIAVELAFGVEDPTEVLHPDELRAMGIPMEQSSSGAVLEWDVDQYLSAWNETSNGLQYQLVKLRHRFLRGRYARGKCYELRHLTDAEKCQAEQYLFRHTEVCERIGAHSHIANNITVANVDGLWWVLDRWEDGITLDHRLEEGPLGDYELRIVMSGIARGLAALHGAGIIRRELSPESVLLRERNDLPILTDMEMAKLDETQPTVSPSEWPDDPYRAIEVTGNAPIDARADIYSWARVFVHAATGELPQRGKECLSGVQIPTCVRDIVEQSLAITPSGRPGGMKPILKALKAWS